MNEEKNRRKLRAINFMRRSLNSNREIINVMWNRGDRE